MLRPAAVFAAFVALLFSFSAHTSQAQVGQSSAVFLLIEPDARSSAMGGTGVASAQGSSAVFWNPAGLTDASGTQVAFTRSEWLPELSSDMSFNFFSASHAVNDRFTLGGHFTYLDMGSSEGRTADGLPTRTFSSFDAAVGVSAGYQLSSKWSLGTGVRYVHSDLAPGMALGGGQDAKSSTVAFDVGALYRPSSFVTIGASLNNMGGQLEFTEEETAGDPIPTTLRVGYSLTFDNHELHKITLSNDITKLLVRREGGEADSWTEALVSSWGANEICQGPSEDPQCTSVLPLEQLMISAGAEYEFDELFALRAGYFYESPNNGNRQFITLGAGAQYEFIGVDFSYLHATAEDSPLAETMRFTASFRF